MRLHFQQGGHRSRLLADCQPPETSRRPRRKHGRYGHRQQSPGWLTRLSTVCIVAVSCGVQTRPGAAADAPTAVETLASALEKQLATISSIDVEYTYTHVWNREEIEQEGSVTKERKAKWSEQGDWRLIKEALLTPPNRLTIAHAFDGEKGWHFDWRTDQKRGRLFIARDLGSAYGHAKTPAYAIGRRLPYTDTALRDVLRLPTAVLVGQEVVAESKCWRIDATGFSNPHGHALKLALHLDPAHDYLPVKIAVWYDNAEIPFERSHQVWKVSEFMRVRDGADGRERWFPRLVMNSQARGGTVVFNISAVKINEPLPREQFRVDAPQGAIVTEE